MTNEPSPLSMAIRTVLSEASARLRLLFAVVENCFGQLDDAAIWHRTTPKDNAIGNLALHVAGDLREWIVCGIGGFQDKRDREAEFAARGNLTKPQVLAVLRDATEESCNVVENLPTDRIGETIHVTDVDRTVAYALLNAIGHTGIHVGQVQLMTKNLVRGAYKETWANPPGSDDNR